MPISITLSNVLRSRNAWLCGFVTAVSLSSFSVQVVAAIATPATSEIARTPAGLSPVMQLASRIAHTSDSSDKSAKLELVSSYESVYGSIGKVPGSWPALVRRTLVCRQMGDHVCVHSSMDALKSLGGIDTFPLNHLFEVSRFGMTVNTVRASLNDGRPENSGVADREYGAGKDEHSQTPAENRSDNKNDNKPDAKTEKAEAAKPEEKSVRAVDARLTAKSSSPIADDSPASVSVAEIAKPLPLPTNSEHAVKPAKPARTFAQRASAKLSRLADNQAGFFLDALFIVVVICLLLIYFLFSALRSRRTEHIERLQAMQEILHLQELQTEEKLKAEHEIWSEQLKSEVALEAQKAHSDELLRMAQLTADEALQSEKSRFDETLKTEQAKVEQAHAERKQAQEALKAEQLKTEEAIKAAKLRSDQAIDAYDQMAARELVYAHKQNDELQESLDAESARREALELKNEEILQTIEAHKQKEAQLLESLRTEQRARAADARQATEKLKAAQQAAAALQASLATTRELNTQLQQRADEAARAAELRTAEAGRWHVAQPGRGMQDVSSGLPVEQAVAPQRNQSY